MPSFAEPVGEAASCHKHRRVAISEDTYLVNQQLLIGHNRIGDMSGAAEPIGEVTASCERDGMIVSEDAPLVVQ